MGTMYIIPGFDNVMRGNDPLGLLGNGLFTEADMDDEKYRPLILHACSILKKGEAKIAKSIKDSILQIHEKYKSSELSVKRNNAVSDQESLEIEADKKYSVLKVLILSLALTFDFDISLNLDVDINELWDQVSTLADKYEIQ